MTFFANSGIAWVQHEEATRKAGGNTLEGGSDLLKIFATLERADQVDSQTVDRKVLDKCAENFDQASSTYRTIASQIDGSDRRYTGLTSAEIELAALHPYGYTYRDDEPFSESFLSSKSRTTDLYNELAERLEVLSSAVRAFEPNRKKSDLAAQVFQMMKHLESAARLGRVIAVRNRRA
jgi:hypothetical protein